MRDSIYWIWLQSRLGYASPHAARAVRELGGAAEIYSAGAESLPFLSPRLRAAAEDKRLEEAQRIADYCAVKRIGVITWGDESYPPLLRSLENPPLVLYVRGTLPDMSRELCIAVVGTRDMSNYGQLQSCRFAHALASGGAVVVSGMALGADGAAAAGALEAGGLTVAVLGCGVDICYPPEHGELMKAIISSGAVISEYPPGERANPARFPERNRIISGLCRGTLVTEAGKISGALITAKTALKQGRVIYAVPGRVGEPGSEGTNRLLKEGAAAVTRGLDIISEYAFLYPDKISLKEPQEMTDEQAAAAMARFGAARRAREDTAKGNGDVKPGYKKSAGAASGKTGFITLIPGRSEKREEPGNGRRTAEDERLSLIDEETKRIYSAIPKDKSFFPEEGALAAFDIGQVLCALTVLEINGLVKALPGGRYTVN